MIDLGIFLFFDFWFAKWVFLDELSFSDNGVEFKISDLSSTSDSGSEHKANISYHFPVPTTGSKQLSNAQRKKMDRDRKNMSNRKINYFLATYAKIDPSNYLIKKYFNYKKYSSELSSHFN